ncbi:MAG TPA: hypothetical protein VFT44_18550 [Pyrinomonadaceae bacterium]|nr:hypothetical protein [Pyrinomonadaceae bacterium]
MNGVGLWQGKQTAYDAGTGILSPNEALKVNNIDENLNGTLAFFEANRFQITLKQYEMIRALL